MDATAPRIAAVGSSSAKTESRDDHGGSRNPIIRENSPPRNEYIRPGIYTVIRIESLQRREARAEAVSRYRATPREFERCRLQQGDVNSSGIIGIEAVILKMIVIGMAFGELCAKMVAGGALGQ